MSPLLTSRRRVVALFAVVTCVAAVAVPQAASASADHSKVTLFPSNALTVRDPFQVTGRRVALPLPNCTTNPTDCNTDRQLNKLDGFDIDPRIAMTFAHAVDAATVAADTTLTQLGVHHAQPIGVDRVVYDSSTNTVYAHPSSQLASDATYLLKVKGAGVPSASTTFTTESATIGLENMRAQLDSGLAYALAGIAPGARGLHIDANVPAAGTTLTYAQDEGTV
ncbi:MAG TPA: Ig-like domain-containing protein, partial [Micromonosporaceae bacterium]